MCGVGGAGAQTAGRTELSSFERPDAETVRTKVADILADPRFAPTKSLMQRLLEKLSSWKGPNFHMPKGLGRVLLWVFVVWAVLTLVAILAHLVWTLVTVFGGGRHGGKLGWGRARTGRQAELAYDDLCRRMRDLAERGMFRQAIAAMMLALLRWLDRAEIVRFHHSKTNGDYVGEYPVGSPGRKAFAHFSLAFDGVVYGAAPCGPDTYREMQSLFERVQHHARKEP